VRPHRLRLQAFGSFAGAQELDLDQLAASGLFLLHGETGAGKTTLLDAICFALYGRVPRYGSRPGRLRSDHAPADLRTEVQLEVTLGGRRLRITRRPAQERPKSRGAGTTTEQASVLLDERRGEDWEPVSQRLDEVGAELETLLGMTADQFQQVVLLPQGEFASFLKAKNDERAALLQRLFSTERFRAVEDWLAARRIATAAELSSARQGIDVLEARFAQAAGVELSDERSSSWAGDLLVLARSAAQEGAADVEAARSAVLTARVSHDAAVALAGLQSRRRTHLTALAALDAAQPAQDALAVELAAAGRAAELASGLAESDRREAERAAVVVAEATARAALAGTEVPVGAGPVELRAAAEAAAGRVGLLEGLRGEADEVAREAAGAEALEAEVAGSAERLAALAAALPELPLRVAEARAGLADAREAAEQVPAAQAGVRALADALTEARALATATRDLAALREERLTARERAADLREAADDLRRARLDAMVAELADRLDDEGPCPVCGSVDHPDPYVGSADRVTHEQEEQAREAADLATAAVGDVEVRLAAALTRAAQHRTRLAALAVGDDVAALTEAHDEQSAVLVALTARAGRQGAAERALDDALRADADARTQHAELTAAQTGLAQRASEARERVRRSQAALLAQLDGADDLQAALALTRTRKAACEGALEAAERALRAGEEAAAALASVTGAATAAGFADLGSARAASRTPSWRQDTERQRRTHDEARAAAVAALADPELDVPLEPVAVVDDTAVLLAEAALSRAGSDRAQADLRARELDALAPQLSQALEDLVPLQETAARARAMADLCAGTSTANTLRMSLTSFVLAARLEEVAAMASQRLLRMTQGRYSLVHTDGAAARGARSGLGLLARDTWTGQDRETSTLSGGETFLASLALALGLADVVQAEAGGARIEALFVDEGFGTLDEDTLDEVMDVLDGLREGGRVVGVVSHVAELRARIPAQVRVRKARDGSSLEVLGC
jgi:exonuclease SbcC